MLRKRASTAIITGCFVLLMVLPLRGEEITKSIVATRASSSISVDGYLTDPAWEHATVVSDFTQYDPEEGAQPTERTTVKVLYDDDALYVGVVCYDSNPSAITRQLTRRDRTSLSDRFSVIIDSYHDHQTAFLFSGSVSGVVSDGVLSQDGLVYDVQWDAVWDYSAKVNSDGWSGEFKIPFSALRFCQQDTGYVWGINFRRYIARKNETDEWVMVPRNAVPPGTISIVSKMGLLKGVEGIKPPLHLEILPYTVSKVSDLYVPELSSLHREITGNAGVDIKYGLSNNFTLDAAINPDFGQVEVDQAVLNLTVFETFYPEKRPFFLEGSQIFSFGTLFDNRSLNLFYSRRIGKQPFPPGGVPDSGYFFVNKPQTTTILGAGKFTGRTDGGLSVGLLSAVTRQEEGIEQNSNGVLKPQIVFEPQASYNVLRLKQDLDDKSSVGLMATGTFKDTRFPSASGGVDWRLRSDDGVYGVDGYFAGAMQTPSPGTPLSGTAGRIGIGKLQADHLLAFSFYDFSTRNFNIDDLGYYSQPRDHGGYTQITYKEDHADAPVLRYASAFEANYRWDWGGNNTISELEFNPSVQFRNFWTATIDYVQHFPAYDDANQGIVGLYRRPAGSTITTTVQTDIRQPVSAILAGLLQTADNGMDQKIFEASLVLRPTTWMELDPGLTYVTTQNEETWVIPQYTDDGHNLFGLRNLEERDINLRGTVTLAPQFSIQFFTQVLLAKVHYWDFRELVSPTELAVYDYEHSASYYDPDFNEHVVNANVVLRWEYLPGSTVYLVWTQARDGYVDPFTTSFGHDFSTAFSQPVNNVFLLKISYLWGL